MRRLLRGLRLPFGGEAGAAVQRVRAMRKDFDAGQRRLALWVEAVESVADESGPPAVIFYREPEGEREMRAYHTHDIDLERAVA